MRVISLISAVALTAAACSGAPRVVNTGESPVQAEPSASPIPTGRPNNADLMDAHDYFANSHDQPGYYFTTPSGKWRCAILPRTKAGCQASTAGSGMGIRGEPDTVVDAAGQAHPPNAIVVESAGDAHFAWLDQPQFWLVPGPANALPFNKILAAAGFRCNVQESGVSCLSESTRKGFTFSADGYTLSYTDVPVGPPS